MANGLYAAIAQGGTPIQIENPLNQMARLSAIQGAQQEQQLNALRLTEAQRGAEETAALRNYLSGVTDVSSPEVRSKLMTGFGLKGLEYSKALSERDKNAAELANKRFNLIKDKTNYFRDALANVNTPEDARIWTAATYSDPDVGPTLQQLGGNLEQALARVPTDAAAFTAWKNQAALGAQKFIDLNRMRFNVQDTGGTTRLLQTPGLGGEATVVPGSQVAKTMAPGEAQRLAISQAAEARQQREFADRNQAIAQQVVDAAGNVRFFNRLGQEITPTAAGGGEAVPVRGKPSATFEKAEAQRKQLSRDLNTAISELRDASKPGGLIDQSTGSGIGRAVDVGARFVGQATSGDIAIGKLAPIADTVLKMVPRFEGPQSDKDTKSYKEAAGQLADATLPREIRKEAAKTIIRLMENRRGQFVTQEMAGEGTGAGAGAAAPRLSAEDQRALNWANSNPNDPRAAQIKQNLGVR
jgi:hypothetical protein